MNNSSSDIRIKCVLLGDQGVGKTSLVHRYILDRYHSFNETTIGASYNAKPIVYNNTTYKLDIWDTAGQERYRSMVPLYYRNANVVFLCIDLSNKYLKESFVYWYDTLKNNKNSSSSQIIYLVGTKSDIKCDEVDEIIQDITNQYNDIHYIETSSKENSNVYDLFLNSTKIYIDTFSEKIPNEVLDITNKPKKYFCFFL